MSSQLAPGFKGVIHGSGVFKSLTLLDYATKRYIDVGMKGFKCFSKHLHENPTLQGCGSHLEHKCAPSRGAINTCFAPGERALSLATASGETPGELQAHLKTIRTLKGSVLAPSSIP